MANLEILQHLVVDALKVVHFQIVRNAEDIDKKTEKFSPEMAHQIFGENENIFGYEDLAINLYYAAGPLDVFLKVDYAKKLDPKKYDGIKADDVVKSMQKSLPSGVAYVPNKNDFLKVLDKAEDFKPFGEKLHEFTSRDAEGVKRHFEIYFVELVTPKFVEFFDRLQSFILWFVDAASYIDLDDVQWNYFVCYEKFKNKKGNYQYATAGYTTVYKYYAYPENIRPRISQMLVLPPFQKLGIGSNMIKQIYNKYAVHKDVIDITVEDPSEDFQKMRNYIDCKLCKKLPAFSEEKLKKGFSNDMVTEARKELKINPKQCRVIYEILRLYYTNCHNEKEYKKYRLAVKQRLNHHYSRQLKCIEKMEKLKLDTQMMKATIPSKEQRWEQLDQEYKQLEENYEIIVDKLKN